MRANEDGRREGVRRARTAMVVCACPTCSCRSQTFTPVCGFCRAGLHVERLHCLVCGKTLGDQIGDNVQDCGHCAYIRRISPRGNAQLTLAV